jgi:hypothetical protein
VNEPDKVLNMVRETMLHENVLERFTFECHGRQATLEFWQPDPQQAWPDIYLDLTFSGVVSLSLDTAHDRSDFAGDVVSFTCERSGDLYSAHITTRAAPSGDCQLRLTFSDLHYDRDPSRNA